MAKKNTDTGQVTETKENDNVQSSERETAVLTVSGENKPDLYDPKFVKEAMKHKDNIGKEFGKIDKSIFKVAFEVYWFYDNNAYIPLGYDNIYDLAKAEFGIARGTTSDYINMVCRFGKRDELDNFTGKIMEKYEAYSSSKLIAMHDLLDSEIDSLLKPEMSVREIKGIVNKAFGKSDEKLPENESDPGKGKENESDPGKGKESDNVSSKKDGAKAEKEFDISSSKESESSEIDTGVSISDPKNLISEMIEDFRKKIEHALKRHEQFDCILQCARLIVYVYGAKDDSENPYTHSNLHVVDYCKEVYLQLFDIGDED